MKDYLKKAIENGEAIDCYEHPEKVREIYESQIGFMRDVFANIDEVIDSAVILWRDAGVGYIRDIRNNIHLWQMHNLSTYLDILLNNFKKELKSITENSKVTGTEDKIELSEVTGTINKKI